VVQAEDEDGLIRAAGRVDGGGGALEIEAESGADEVALRRRPHNVIPQFFSMTY
jgi:hypothetical protein